MNYRGVGFTFQAVTHIRGSDTPAVLQRAPDGTGSRTTCSPTERALLVNCMRRTSSGTGSTMSKVHPNVDSAAGLGKVYEPPFRPSIGGSGLLARCPLICAMVPYGPPVDCHAQWWGGRARAAHPRVLWGCRRERCGRARIVARRATVQCGRGLRWLQSRFSRAPVALQSRTRGVERDGVRCARQRCALM